MRRWRMVLPACYAILVLRWRMLLPPCYATPVTERAYGDTDNRAEKGGGGWSHEGKVTLKVP
eukprot:1044377-Rhodomonas_salina.1